MMIFRGMIILQVLTRVDLRGGSYNPDGDSIRLAEIVKCATENRCVLTAPEVVKVL